MKNRMFRSVVLLLVATLAHAESEENTSLETDEGGSAPFSLFNPITTTFPFPTYYSIIPTFGSNGMPIPLLRHSNQRYPTKVIKHKIIHKPQNHGSYPTIYPQSHTIYPTNSQGRPIGVHPNQHGIVAINSQYPNQGTVCRCPSQGTIGGYPNYPNQNNQPYPGQQVVITPGRPTGNIYPQAGSHAGNPINTIIDFAQGFIQNRPGHHGHHQGGGYDHDDDHSQKPNRNKKKPYKNNHKHYD